MNRQITLFVVFVIFVTLFSSPMILHSSPTKSDSTKKYGIGIQSAPFPVFGISFIYNLNENLGLQAIGRLGIDVDFLSVRALYRFKRRPKYNIYFSGLLGAFRDNDVQTSIFAPDETDEAFGFGLGGGLEYFFSCLPNIGFNLEVDFIHINFEEKWWQYDYKSFSLLMIGIGAFYYF